MHIYIYVYIYIFIYTYILDLYWCSPESGGVWYKAIEKDD